MQGHSKVFAGPVASTSNNGAVLQAVPFPNPNPLSLRIRLYKDAEQVCIRIYRPDAVLLGERCAGPFGAGWSTLSLPAEWAESPPGRYYFTVNGGGQYDADQAGTMVRQR